MADRLNAGQGGDVVVTEVVEVLERHALFAAAWWRETACLGGA